MSAELDARIEARGNAIREARIAATKLCAQSEVLRKAIDDLDVALLDVSRNGVELQKRDRIYDRLLNIRRARNGMECFALQCWVTEACDKAWKELP